MQQSCVVIISCRLPNPPIDIGNPIVKASTKFVKNYQHLKSLKCYDKIPTYSHVDTTVKPCVV